MARTQQPPINVTSQGAVSCGVGIHLGDSVWIFQGAGAPTDGTSGDGAAWAEKGSQYNDRTNGKAYINTGTKASPTWTAVGSVT